MVRDDPSPECDRGTATDITAEPAKKVEEPAEELPDVDEATVGQLSEEVCFSYPLSRFTRLQSLTMDGRPGRSMPPS